MGTLRFLLALSVAYGHFTVTAGFPTADIAVQSFFVVSGFYMTMVLREKYPPGSYRLFISNRLLRLWPAYIVVLAASLLVATSWRAVAALDGSAIIFFAVSQFLIIGQDLYLYLFVHDAALAFTAHFTTTSTPFYSYAPIQQAWSLGLEIEFYLLAPFILRRGPRFIAVLILGSLALRMGLQYAFGLSGNPWSFRFFPSEIALFLTGSLGYFVYAAETKAQLRRARLLLIAAAALVVACLAVNSWHGIERLVSLSVLTAVILGIPWLFAATKAITWDKYVGELSYPLYISHLLAAWIILPETYAGVYLALLFSLIFSVALYHLVDRPIDQWRQTRLRRHEPENRGARLAPSIQSG
jgi:peptidoglycan/LPS O-acetylase OafA/YrhL